MSTVLAPPSRTPAPGFSPLRPSAKRAPRSGAFVSAAAARVWAANRGSRAPVVAILEQQLRRRYAYYELGFACRRRGCRRRVRGSLLARRRPPRCFRAERAKPFVVRSYPCRSGARRSSTGLSLPVPLAASPSPRGAGCSPSAVATSLCGPCDGAVRSQRMIVHPSRRACRREQAFLEHLLEHHNRPECCVARW